ncbi:MAG: hypothetical protein U5M50_04030 [Sphingobium sp.]|nr:hypothetical protein [Sphingobium sp.]
MQRYQASRVATVTETGRQTLRLPDRPHWRDIPGHKPATTMTQRKRALSARDGIVSAGAVGRDPVPESAPVDRDPCFRCGVRGDLGCKHRRAVA